MLCVEVIIPPIPKFSKSEVEPPPPPFLSSFIMIEAETWYTGVWKCKYTQAPIKQAKTETTNQGQWIIYLKRSSW